MLLLSVLLVELVLLTMQKSQAFFSDSAVSSLNTFTAVSEFSGSSGAGGPSGESGPLGPSGIANHPDINEVYYDVGSLHQFIDEDHSEWVEIYNPLATEVDLTGWTIKDSQNSSEPLGGLLPAGNFLLLIATDAASFQTKWTVPPGTILMGASGPIGNTLANMGDSLILENNESEVDRMSWGTNTSGFISGCTGNCPDPGDGHSLEREPDGFDNDDAYDFKDRSSPSPGS